MRASTTRAATDHGREHERSDDDPHPVRGEAGAQRRFRRLPRLGPREPERAARPGGGGRDAVREAEANRGREVRVVAGGRRRRLGDERRRRGTGREADDRPGRGRVGLDRQGRRGPPRRSRAWARPASVRSAANTEWRGGLPHPRERDPSAPRGSACTYPRRQEPDIHSCDMPARTGYRPLCGPTEGGIPRGPLGQPLRASGSRRGTGGSGGSGQGPGDRVGVVRRPSRSGCRAPTPASGRGARRPPT